MAVRKSQRMTQEQRYWRKWNLGYTKRVLAGNPRCQMAQALLSCWSPRVQRALRARFSLVEAVHAD